MREAANVRSIDAIKRFRAGLCEFADTSRNALAEAQSDIQRTIWWLQQDQMTHWQTQLRKRTERVNQARTELARAQLAAGDRPSMCVDERKALQKAQRALAEAEEKLKRTRQWVRQLDRELMLYRGQVQHLGAALDRDVPRGVARLESMISSLESYVQLRAPTTSEPTPAPAPPSEEDPS
jgi:uncharacterized protein (DUF3084 family)